MKNILSIDVEECFHSEYIRNCDDIEFDHRTPRNLDGILKILDEFKTNATFFVTGEIAERFRNVLDKISENGHEIAFHGYSHEPLWRLDAERLKLEIKKFNSLVKERCVGFRAPSFSMNNETKWALRVLEETNYEYDSSVFPAKTTLYGVPSAPVKPYKPSVTDLTKEDGNGRLWEFPLLVYPFLTLRIPTAGGFYLRLFPIRLLERAVKKMNKCGEPAVMYVHNWELDVKMPRSKVSLYRSFITYYNIERTEKKLKHLLSNFRFTTFVNYLEENGLHC